jgi:hypothetical protein
MADNVFCNDPAGACVSNDPEHFRPEVARVFFPELLAGRAKGLAGVSSANKVNCSGVLVAVELADVAVDRDSGPVASQHPLAIRIDLTKGGGAHSGSFEAEAESSNSAE